MKSATKDYWLLGLVLMVALCVACPKRANVNPTKTLVPIEAATFGLSNSYQVSPYPVDNFGILTAYKPPQGERWDESNEICDNLELFRETLIKLSAFHNRSS